MSNGRYGPGNHSDAVKRAAVAGFYSRSESAEVAATSIRKKSPPLDTEIAELERRRDGLQHTIRELQIEHGLLETASELINKDIGGDLQSLSNREKTLLIVAQKINTSHAICWRA